ncbi:hypothetical protein BURPSS13_C0042 [Burkholderia pseudomallei S13]|nr:hypothetical protein BURPSS13_C0042 [Burkholderia pseudomallei S13]
MPARACSSSRLRVEFRPKRATKRGFDSLCSFATRCASTLNGYALCRGSTPWRRHSASTSCATSASVRRSLTSFTIMSRCAIRSSCNCSRIGLWPRQVA